MRQNLRLSNRFIVVYGTAFLLAGLMLVGFLCLRQDLDDSLPAAPPAAAIKFASTSAYGGASSTDESASSPSSASPLPSSPSGDPSPSTLPSSGSSLSAYGGSLGSAKAAADDSSAVKNYHLGKKSAGVYNPSAAATSAATVSLAYVGVQRGGGDAPLHQRARIANTNARPLGPFGNLKRMRQSHALSQVLFKVSASLESVGLEHWAVDSTLVGLHLHASLLPYELEAHLAVESTDISEAYNTLSTLEGLYVYYGKDKLVVVLHHERVRVNIFSFFRVQSDQKEAFSCPQLGYLGPISVVLPPRMAMCGRKLLPVPAHTEQYLAMSYHNTTDRVWNWKANDYLSHADAEDLPAPAFPLVSVIIPTHDRPHFLPKALQLISQQDYPNIEVIIVDDGPVFLPQITLEQMLSRCSWRGPDWVRYYHLSERKSIGMKRNIAVSFSKGEIIAHWDDDDYFREHRISEQARPVITGQVDMTSLDHYLYFVQKNASFFHVQRKATVGPHLGTFLWHKRVWDEKGIRFPDASQAEDYAFCEFALYANATILVMPNDDGKHIYVRHHNTWAFDLKDMSALFHIEEVKRPEYFTDEDFEFFSTVKTKNGGRPPQDRVAQGVRWDRPELLTEEGRAIMAERLIREMRRRQAPSVVHLINSPELS